MSPPIPGSAEARREPARVLIMGAAGRDFHNFNTVFRDDPGYAVVAFTAAQIPDIAGRRYPAALAGRLYPHGIPIQPEEELTAMIGRESVDQVFLSYSDLRHEDVMHKASIVLAAGASFALLGPAATMLKAAVPVVSVCAVRTGVGKSALSRHVLKWLAGRGHRVVAVRHPMPYGDLEKQAVQRFATFEDLDRADATIEEREEYEPYIESGAVVFAGVDYARDGLWPAADPGPGGHAERGARGGRRRRHAGGPDAADQDRQAPRPGVLRIQGAWRGAAAHP